MTSTYNLPNISIQPNKLTFFYQSDGNQSYRENQPKQAPQPNSTNTGRNLSEKARKRIQSKIHWLLTYAKKKRVFNDYTNKFFTFKINFITLTLPAFQAHTDKTIKSKALNQFLTEMRTRWKMRNFVWRAECQRNGNIHFHIVSDTYIPWFIIRSTWNRQLRKLGYIDRYKKKFRAMDWEDYKLFSMKNGTKDLSIILKRWNYGNKTNWADPNTTDIHSVQKIKNLGAYLSKYMAKKQSEKSSQQRYEIGERRISGRLWGCSQSLSRCKSIIKAVDSTISRVMDVASNTVGAFVKIELYYSFVGVDFRNLRKEAKQVLNRLFLDYKAAVGYISGSQRNINYQYS